jgi:Raf kinase inhibitor-like YbhB/YbcL family protein
VLTEGEMKRRTFLIIVGTILFVLIALATVIYVLRPIRGETFSSAVELPPTNAGFILTSPDFKNGSPIPARFTCDGEDVPPTLTWGEPPIGTKSFALIMEDPDAPLGTWTHWIVYNIPVGERLVDDLYRPHLQVNNTTIFFGKNSWGKQTYGGPCPPSGIHHYVFQLYALDEVLTLADKASKAELQAAIQGHVVGYAELTGTYTK